MFGPLAARWPPRVSEYLIKGLGGRAQVAQYQAATGNMGGIYVVAAENWPDLEAEALHWLQSQGAGNPLPDGEYKCPPELSAKAKFYDPAERRRAAKKKIEPQTEQEEES